MNIEHHADITEPQYINKDNCLVITSPEQRHINSRESAYVDLKFNVELEKVSDFMEFLHMPQIWLKLSCVFKMMGLYIEDTKLGNEQNKKQHYSTTFIE